MSRFAAITFSQKLKMSMFSSTGKGKGLPAGRIDWLFAKIGKVKLTKELTRNLCLAIGGIAMYIGTFMVRSSTKKLEEIQSQKLKRTDSIHKLRHLCFVKLGLIESKPNQ